MKPHKLKVPCILKPKHKHRKIIITTYWNLANMEDQHRKIFTKIRTALTEKEKDPKVFDPYNEASQYLAEMVKTMDGEGSPSVADSLTGNKALEEILRTAVGLEKDKENNSLITIQWNTYGIAGGNELRALIFMVITVTVLSAGLTGGLVSQILDLRRPSDSGWVILGANELARACAKILLENNEEVICIDANPDVCNAAEQDCTRVIFGNGLKTHYLLRAEIDTRAGVLAITGNEEVNLLFIQKARKVVKLPHIFMALQDKYERVILNMVHETGSQVLFGGARDVDFWSVCIRNSYFKTCIAGF